MSRYVLHDNLNVPPKASCPVAYPGLTRSPCCTAYAHWLVSEGCELYQVTLGISHAEARDDNVA